MKNNFWANFVFYFFIVVSFIMFFLISLIIYFEKKLDDKIYPSVYIDGLPVGYKTKQELYQKLSSHLNLDKINIKIVYADETVAEINGKDLQLELNTLDAVEHAYLIGRSPHLPSRIYQKVASVIGLESYDFFTRVNYNHEQIDKILANAKETYNKPVQNALFSFVNGKVEKFREQKNGRLIDEHKFYEDIERSIQSLKRRQQDIVIFLHSHIVEPEVNLEKTNNFGIEELIGEGTSDYTHSSPERIHNLTLATKKLNGVMIPPGAEFSFNKAVGEISTLTGYLPSYIIKDGKTILGDGGGVCQVSTTLFRTVMHAGLPIVEHHNHAYRVQYYENDAPPGLDATVYPPYVDFRFKNDTKAHILIQTQVDTENNLLKFKLYGKKDNRVVELSPVVLSNFRPAPPPQYQDDPTLKKGTTKQIEVAQTGVTATFNYLVRRDNKLIFEKKFVLQYQPWRSVFLVGQAE